MRPDWLWDRKISVGRSKKILSDFSNKESVLLASLLLARKNEPKEVFKEYLDPMIFCQQWPVIKKRMRQDKWNEPRIIFWQAIYEKLTEKYQKRGILVKKAAKKVKDIFLVEIGNKIITLRKENGLSQKKLAKRLNVSQQLISRIESGNENVSISTLRNILSALNRNIKIEFDAIN